MDNSILQKWLDEPRHALIAAVAQGVHKHVGELRSRGIEFYGYALLPGEFYRLQQIVAVANTDVEIKVSREDRQYCYYRYCVDEWAHWEYDGFAAANALLVEANGQFKSLHSKAEDDFRMDEFEIAHANVLLYSVVKGIETAKMEGAFADREPFLVVWISDSGHEIMVDSVKRLNPPALTAEFEEEFD